MKVLNKVIIGMASLVLLTACGPSKVSYAKFHEQAVEAVKKEVSYTKVAVKGSEVAGSVTLQLDLEYTLKDGKWELTKGDIVNVLVGTEFIAMTADTILEDEGTTYYAGGGFKAEKGENKAAWNANARLTSFKSVDGNNKADVKLTWSK